MLLKDNNVLQQRMLSFDSVLHLALNAAAVQREKKSIQAQTSFIFSYQSACETAVIRHKGSQKL